MSLLIALLGCGTTRFTDTSRTATEQLLITSAVDRAVSRLDCQVLAGKRVYFDPKYIEARSDKGYVVSSLRQHLLANGCLLMDDRDQADYIVEARCGAIGTDRHDLLFGVPQMQLPAVVPWQPITSVPEIPFAKKTDQKGVAKLAVYAFNRHTGRPLWQSGITQDSSYSKDLWVLGAGPFRSGSIAKGTEFAGESIEMPFISSDGSSMHDDMTPGISVTQPAVWNEPPMSSDNLRLVGHEEKAKTKK